MKEKFLLTLMVVLFCVVSVQAGTETLLHRWSFTTDTSDSVGTADGIISGVAGVAGGKLDCRGAGSMSTPGIKASVEVERSLTVELWMTDVPAPAVSYPRFLHWGYGEWTNSWELINHDYQGSQFKTDLLIAGEVQVVDAATPMQGDHHVVVVFDLVQDIMFLYKDGAYIGEVALGGRSIDDLDHDNVNMAYVIGAFYDETAHWPLCQYDEYRIWDGAMNAAEVAAAYGLGPDNAAVPEIEIPTVTMLSVSESYAATTAVTLAVEATDTTSYQWYKNGSTVGTDANTLAIPSMSASDNGVYYCEVTGAGGTVATGEIHIAVKDLVAHYEFNDDLTDSSGHGNHLQVDIGSAVYAAEGDVDGKSLDVTAADRMKLVSAAVDIPMHDQDYTIIVWAKSDTDQETQHFVGWGDVSFTPGQYNLLSTFPATPAEDVYGVVNYWGNTFSAPNVVYAYYTRTAAPWDAYRMYAATYEGTQGEKAVYVDGRLEANATYAASYDIDQAGANALKVGWAGTAFASNGAMFDDIKIYNYALTDEEIAQEYFDVTGKTICTQATGTYDIDVDDNCVINLIDFAQIAADWLDCTILPATECP